MYHARCKPGPATSDSAGPPSAANAPPRDRRRSLIPFKWRPLAAVSAVLLLAVGVFSMTTSAPPRPRGALAPQISAPKPQPAARPIGKPEVQRLTAGTNFLNLTDSRIEIRRGNSCYTLQTTLDVDLQQFLIQRLDRKNSRYIGIVAMDPRDGRVLAMAGYDKANPDGNPCLDSRFPAASIFKIITAAAAVETRDLDPDSILRFSGGKYTLYKSQINARPSKYLNRITLQDSFAQSVNPVFGRLGANLLGREVIETYAEAFGFNREIDFELPLRPSRIELTGGAFELAEIASGYNRSTRISPLHGAMMAAAVVNQGRWVEPSIVDWILNDDGRTVYQNQTVYRDQAIDLETARVLRRLMQATVQSGTAHKEFQKHHSDPILSRLEIGGKTGSMGDEAAETRYDWFVGYAREPQGSGQLVFAVVVAHEEYIGTRAAAYAAMAIKEYFKGHFARLEKPAHPKS
jgi:penicillin-binding protein A